MKKFVLLLNMCFLLTQLVLAQNFLKNSPFKNTFNVKDVHKAIKEMKDYYKVENGTVSFIQIIDSLPHKASDIYASALEYMTETYSITKYEIQHNNPEKGLIVGEGEFNAFASYAAYPNQYTFTCKPSLRIDAKNGKARVCVSVKTYQQIRMNGGIKEEKEVNLTDVSPINPDSDKSEKMYNKVFLAFAQKAMEVIEDFSDFMSGKLPEDVEDW